MRVMDFMHLIGIVWFLSISFDKFSIHDIFWLFSREYDKAAPNRMTFHSFLLEKGKYSTEIVYSFGYKNAANQWLV